MVAISLREASRFFKHFPLLLVLIASLFSGCQMYAQLSYPELNFNDGAFHLSVLKMLEFAIEGGQNPLDFWYSGTPFGFALFRSYQYFPYLLIYSAYVGLWKLFTLSQVFAAANVLLVVLLPWSVYWALRVVRLEKIDAAIAAVASVLISDGGEFGFGLQNYTFGTNGLYTQLWAMLFVAPAIAFAYRYLLEGRYLTTALLFGFLTFGCHVVAAFVLFFSVGFLALSFVIANPRGSIATTLKRVVFYFTLLALVTSHQWLFVLLDAPYINQSSLEPQWKYAGRGLSYVLTLLWSGGSVDAGRLPVLTLFMFVGCCAALFQPQQSDFAKKTVWLAALLLSLYAGHEVWGSIFTTLPVFSSLHVHRFAVGFHLYVAALVGVGAGTMLRLSKDTKLGLLLVSLAIAGAFYPAFKERNSMYRNAAALRHSAGEFIQRNDQIEQLVASLTIPHDGIIYAGASHNWEDEAKQFGIPPHYFATTAGLPTVGGALYHAFSLAGETLFDFDVRRRSHFQLYGIQTVIAPVSWKGLGGSFVKRSSFGNLAVWNTGISPLRLATRSFLLCGNRKQASTFMRRWVQSPLVELGQFGELTLGDCAAVAGTELPRVSYDGLPPLPRRETTSTDNVVTQGLYLPWRLEGRIETNVPRLVVAATGFHPNWKVYIDGKPRKTTWVTPGFLAVEAEAGSHDVRFEYEGSTLKIVLLAAATCAFLVMGFMRSRQGARKHEGLSG
jgi:hypothetical protein